jgi:NADH:ubiquinone oxidoreductase subunit K
MNFQLIIYFNLLIFLLGIFGIFYSRNIITMFVSYQFIIISAIINFLSFSNLLYMHSLWAEVFIISGVISIYFLMFCIVYYIYSKLSLLDKKVLCENYRLFRIITSDWWGEDNR